MERQKFRIKQGKTLIDYTGYIRRNVLNTVPVFAEAVVRLVVSPVKAKFAKPVSVIYTADGIEYGYKLVVPSMYILVEGNAVLRTGAIEEEYEIETEIEATKIIIEENGRKKRRGIVKVKLYGDAYVPNPVLNYVAKLLRKTVLEGVAAANINFDKKYEQVILKSLGKMIDSNTYIRAGENEGNK